MRRKVLLICYYFPPLGLGGVGRPLNLFKKLPLSGWDCDILTVKPVVYRAYEPELLKGLDTSRIYRSGSRDPQRLLYLLGIRRVGAGTLSSARRLSGRFFPDNKVGWVKPAIRLARKLARKNQYHSIVSTSPPISAHLIARQLAHEFRIPWVADFRDLWTSYRIEDTYGSDILVEKGRELLKAFVEQASALTVVNRSIADYVGCGELIPNGYDSDYAALWKTPVDQDCFVIGLLGSFSREVPVAPLVDTLAALRTKNPSLFERIRLLQVGQIDPQWFIGEIEKCQLRERCEMKSLQSRSETVRLLSAASLFYIASPGEEKGIIPGRLFDLLASGRPILAHASGDSEVGRLIRQTASGFCFQHENLAQAADYVARKVTAFTDGSLRIEPRPDYARLYSSDELARRFAEIMDNLL